MARPFILTAALPPAQARYWEAPAKDGEHDPRGEEAYVRGYVDVRHAGGHEPHQNYAVPPPPAHVRTLPRHRVHGLVAGRPSLAAAFDVVARLDAVPEPVPQAPHRLKMLPLVLAPRIA